MPGPPPGDLPDPGIEPTSHVSCTVGGLFTTNTIWEIHKMYIVEKYILEEKKSSSFPLLRCQLVMKICTRCQEKWMDMRRPAPYGNSAVCLPFLSHLRVGINVMLSQGSRKGGSQCCVGEGVLGWNTRRLALHSVLLSVVCTPFVGHVSFLEHNSCN